jgi:hypothetical protein
MLEYERTALVRMAVDASFLLEAAEQRAGRWRVRIVTRGAFERSLAQAMALVVLGFCELLAVAAEANARRVAERSDLRRPRQAQQRRRRVLAMLRVAARAGQSCLRMRAAVERRVRALVARQTAAVSLGNGFVAEREYRRAPGLLQMFCEVAVAVAAREWLSCLRLPIRVVEHRVRITRYGLELVAVTETAAPCDTGCCGIGCACWRRFGCGRLGGGVGRLRRRLLLRPHAAGRQDQR